MGFIDGDSGAAEKNIEAKRLDFFTLLRQGYGGRGTKDAKTTKYRIFFPRMTRMNTD
jgi:hypothetical protein